MTSEKIREYIAELSKVEPQDDGDIKWVITGSYAIHLHCLKHDISQNRMVKDLDLYTFEKFQHFKQEDLFDEYAVHNGQLNVYRTTNFDFYLDLFSCSYLMDTIPPRKTDVKKISVEGRGCEVYVSSIEHLLMLKMLTTYCLRKKDIADISFILDSFPIDGESCKAYLKASRYRGVNFDLDGLRNRGIADTIDSLRIQIVDRYSYVPVDLNLIWYNFLVTLLNFAVIEVEQSKADIDNATSKYAVGHAVFDEIIKLGYVYLVNDITNNAEYKLDTIFKTIIHSIDGFSYNEDKITVFLTRCRYINRLMQQAVRQETIIDLLRRKRFLANYFRLVS